MKALIFAAGKGTRLHPFTASQPKALFPVNGVPLLERNIRYLQEYGVNRFVINVHHFADQIENFLEEKNNFGSEIQISDERAELLETGGGLLFAQNYFQGEENFLIMNSDILTSLNLYAMIDFHTKKQGLVTLAVSERESSRQLYFSENHRLSGWKNIVTGEIRQADFYTKKDIQLAFGGIHCVNYRIFEKIKSRGSFSIISEYLNLMNEEKIFGYQHTAPLIDVGKPEAVDQAEALFK